VSPAITPIKPAIPAPQPPAPRPTPAAPPVVAEVARAAAPVVAQAAVPAVKAAAAAAGHDPRGVEYEAIAKLSRDIIEQIVWEVVPELAERIIRENLDRLAAKR
jgi:hypothetical protein